MGAKSRTPQVSSPTPSPAAAPAAGSATPDQATLGNAEVASQIKAPREEPSMLLGEDSGVGDVWRETQIAMGSPFFFHEQATDDERYRMIRATPVSRMADLLAETPDGQIKRMLSALRPENKLKLIRGRPSALVPTLDEEQTRWLMFEQRAYDLQNRLTDDQVAGLAAAEGGSHPQLVKLLQYGHGDAFTQAMTALSYEEGAAVIAAMGVCSATIVDTNDWGRAKIGKYLDGAMRAGGSVFDSLEAVWRELGRGDEVEWWYQQREANGR